MQLNGPFNAQQHEPIYEGNVFTLIPAAKYKLALTDSEVAANKAGTALIYTVTVIEGQYMGATFRHTINLWAEAPKTLHMAEGQLAALCFVCGVGGINTSEELYNRPFWGDVIQTAPDANGKSYNNLKEIWDINGNQPGKAPKTTAANPAPPVSAAPAGGNGGGWSPAPPAAAPVQPAAAAWGPPAPAQPAAAPAPPAQPWGTPAPGAAPNGFGGPAAPTPPWGSK